MWFRRKRTVPTEATRAVEKAERDLVEIKAETPKYQALARAVRRVVFEENHLGENLTEAFRGNR